MLAFGRVKPLKIWQEYYDKNGNRIRINKPAGEKSSTVGLQKKSEAKKVNKGVTGDAKEGIKAEESAKKRKLDHSQDENALPTKATKRVKVAPAEKPVGVARPVVRKPIAASCKKAIGKPVTASEKAEAQDQKQHQPNADRCRRKRRIVVESDDEEVEELAGSAPQKDSSARAPKRARMESVPTEDGVQGVNKDDQGEKQENTQEEPAKSAHNITATAERAVVSTRAAVAEEKATKKAKHAAGMQQSISLEQMKMLKFSKKLRPSLDGGPTRTSAPKGRRMTTKEKRRAKKAQEEEEVAVAAAGEVKAAKGKKKEGETGRTSRPAKKRAGGKRGKGPATAVCPAAVTLKQMGGPDLSEIPPKTNVFITQDEHVRRCLEVRARRAKEKAGAYATAKQSN